MTHAYDTDGAELATTRAGLEAEIARLQTQVNAANIVISNQKVMIDSTAYQARERIDLERDSSSLWRSRAERLVAALEWVKKWASRPEMYGGPVEIEVVETALADVNWLPAKDAEIEKLKTALAQQTFRAECAEHDLGGVRHEQAYVEENERLTAALKDAIKWIKEICGQDTKLLNIIKVSPRMDSLYSALAASPALVAPDAQPDTLRSGCESLADKVELMAANEYRHPTERQACDWIVRRLREILGKAE